MEGDCQSPISWSRVVKGVGALGVLLRGLTQRRSAGIQARKIDIRQPSRRKGPEGKMTWWLSIGEFSGAETGHRATDPMCARCQIGREENERRETARVERTDKSEGEKGLILRRRGREEKDRVCSGEND